MSSHIEKIKNLEKKHKLLSENLIDAIWTADVETVRNLIRGLSPYPAAWSTLVHAKTGKEISCKIFFAMQVEENSNTPSGTIETDGKNIVKVACANGYLQITDLQIAGKKRMKIQDFLRGFQQIGEYRFQ